MMALVWAEDLQDTKSWRKLIHSFSSYLLSSHDVPGPMLDTERIYGASGRELPTILTNNVAIQHNG